MKTLITGGAGFIGSHLVNYFAGRGHEVHVADRFTYAGKFRNLAAMLPDVALWIGDLKQREFCEKLARFGFDYVVHAAANTDVDISIKDPIGFTFDNVLATNLLLQAFHNRQPAKIVVYSTDEVYGTTPEGEVFWEDAPFNPSNAYSASKVGVEGLAKAYYHTHKAPIVVVRPCNTYGPRQHPGKVIPNFVRLALEGKPLTVYEDGKGKRDWLHVVDHARAIELLLKEGVPGEAYNIPAGQEHSCGEIAEMVCRVLGLKAQIEYVNVRPGHDKRYWMNGSKIAELGWRPKELFAPGFREAVLWFRDHPDWWSHDYLELRQLAAVKVMHS